jgi:5-formyltetrahydrofolate cyclo-ligase
MDKKQARKAALAVRDTLAKSQISEFSDKITESFLSEFGAFDSFLLYSSFRSEVQTHRLIEHLYGMNKAVYLPVVCGEELRIGSYTGCDSLSCGAFGIQEPVECADLKHIDIAVVPGVAFDKELHRIGYGKGYYDRLLGAVRFGAVVGLAFECQLFDTFDCEPHDMPMDVLVTEKYIYRRNS